MQQTFISYSSKDQATAKAVCDGLELRGVKCWISSRDVRPGRNYQEEITLALEYSSSMILIWSVNANSSTQIPNEIALAAENDILLIPLKIDNAIPTRGFKYNLATKQWTDLFPDFENSLDKISKDIKYFTTRNNDVECLVRELFFENGGKVNSNERTFLLEEGTDMGLTEKEAEKIIDHVIGSANNQESEEEYLILVDQVLEDSVVSAIEKKQLDKKAKSLGISDIRAQELLTKAKKNLGIFDTPIKDNVRDKPQLTIEDSKFSPNHEKKNTLFAKGSHHNLTSNTLSDIDNAAANDDAEENTRFSEGTIRDQDRLDFWTQALDSLRSSKTNLYDRRNPNTSRYLNAGSGFRQVPFTIIYLNTQVIIQLTMERLHASDNNLIFKNLYKKKSSIEKAFGYSLTWENIDENKSCRIFYSQDFDCLNRDNWPTIIKWLVENLIKFENAFKAPLNEITANNTLTEESTKVSEEGFEDPPAANTTSDKTKPSQTKNQLTISGKMHVNTLKKQFKNLFGLTLRIYDGRNFADEKATIANIRKVDNKTGEYSPGNNTKLVTIENKMFEVFGLKVQIWGSDDSYTCNRELTLKQAKIEDDKKIERKKTKNIKAKDTMDTKD